MAHELTLQEQCAEDISLLSLLHPVPVQPKRNSVNFVSSSQKHTYTLPLDKEQSLASTVAFISSIKDDPNHIPAVCLGEELDSSHLRILLAVNKAGFSDGNSILYDLKRAFTEIFRILASGFENDHGSSNVEYEVFTAIVSLCSSRILNRLRLMPGRRGPRQSIKDILSQAIDCVNHATYNNTGDSPTARISASFIAAAKETIVLVNSWYKHQTTTRLRDLVEDIYRLHQQQIIHDTLGLVSNKEMDPSLKASLLNMTSKVARYRQAARFLYRTAKHFPIVRRARIESVNLPQEAFHVIKVSEYEPQLLSTISRAVPNYANAKKLGQIWRLLQKTESDALGCFSNQTCDTLQQAKIHAEVQLIYHCELQSAIKFPRVICSSKDACFLCNIFISLHGKMHTPRCHGRLYPGWRLPFIPLLNDLQRQLNHHLESQIKDSLINLVSSQKRTVYPFPQESTLLTLPTSISTLTSSKSYLGASQAPQSDARSFKVNDLLHVSASFDENRNNEVEPNCSALGSSLSEFDGLSASIPLQAGTSLTKRIKKNVSPLYTAGLLEVQIEYDNRSASFGSPHDLLYSVEWLPAVDAKKICHPGCLIEAESIRGEALHALCGQNTLYLRTDGSIIRLRFH